MAANPFVVGDSGDPTAGLPDTKTFDDIRNQWSSFLDKPEGRAALLSFGINLMQPPGFGDTPLGQIGRALGAAGETGTNIEKLNIAQQEAASKEALRAATADTAAMRAAAIGGNQQLAMERLQAQKAAEEHRVGSTKLQAQLKLQAMYNGVKADIETENEKRAADILNTPGSPNYRPPSPVPSFSEYLLNDPIARATAIEAGINVPATPPITTPPPATTTALSPEDQQALIWANANPKDPRAAAIHTKLGR